MSRSLADRYRAHREEMLVALELGCTPREARCEIATRAARQRWCEAKAKLDRKMNAVPRPAVLEDRLVQEAPWMMRD